MADEIGYEAARAELGDVVRRLETGGQSLEDSLALWQRGEELADICQRWLDGASARLDAAIAEHDDAEAHEDADAQVDAIDPHRDEDAADARTTETQPAD